METNQKGDSLPIAQGETSGDGVTGNSNNNNNNNNTESSGKSPYVYAQFWDPAGHLSIYDLDKSKIMKGGGSQLHYYSNLMERRMRQLSFDHIEDVMAVSKSYYDRKGRGILSYFFNGYSEVYSSTVTPVDYFNCDTSRGIMRVIHEMSPLLAARYMKEIDSYDPQTEVLVMIFVHDDNMRPYQLCLRRLSADGSSYGTFFTQEKGGNQEEEEDEDGHSSSKEAVANENKKRLPSLRMTTPENVAQYRVPVCVNCYKLTPDMKRCSKCKIVRYCSSDCMKEYHRKIHSAECAGLKENLSYFESPPPLPQRKE